MCRNIFYLTAVCFLLLSGHHLYAQAGTRIPTVTLDMKQATLPEIFIEIEKQTGMFFSYESSLLQDIPRINFTVSEESFSYTLKQLFENLPFHYRITGQYVIIKKKPRQYTISGFIRDSITYESLINATVYEQLSGKGSTTNSYGFYSITLPAGKVLLRSSYVGFKMQEIRFELTTDTLLDINLIPQEALQEVVVRGNDPYSPVLSSRMGNMELTSAYIKQVPVLFGEPDPLRTLHLMPGVASGSEGLTGMFVRGGGGDENLFLLDGIPIYNTGHIGGIFSTFNPDVIKYVDFYKGGFPARYGGRLSSVMDVRMKEGDMQRYHGSFSFGLLSAKGHLEGPIVKDKTSFNFSFRRTWLDAITAPVFAIANRRNSEEIFAGYSFYDLNTKITHMFSPSSRLYLNFYMGQDRLRYTLWEEPNEDNIQEGEELKWRWGNLVSSANWTYVFNNKLFGNFNLAYTRYKSKMKDKENYISNWWDDAPSYYRNKEEYHYSGIEDLSYKADFDYSPQPDHYIRFGSDYTFHFYHPEQYSIRSQYTDQHQWDQKYQKEIDEKVHAHEWGVYAEDDWTINDRWKLNAGGRITAYHVQQESYFSFQPRLSIRYLLRQNWSLKASYAKMNQYIHQLGTTYANLPSDIWVPVTKNLKPMYSHQVSAGMFYNFRKVLDVSVEAYFKRMNNIVEYQDYASLFPKYNWDDKISVGYGRSYGVEWMAIRSEGRTTGSAAYTLSWADRLFEDRKVNEGKRFPSKYDNRHRVNFTVMHKLSKKVDLSASWTFSTGNRVSVPTKYYIALKETNNYEPDIIDIGHDKHNSNQLLIESVFSRNAVKLGNYHRLDLSLNIYRPKKKGRMAIWNVSLYNAYCRVNPFRIDDVLLNEDGKLEIRQTGFIPIIPSFSYTYKF